MNIGSWVSYWARSKPEAFCVSYADLHLSWHEFNCRVNRVARALVASGIKAGDRVALLLANSNIYLEVFFAAAKIGAVLVPLNFRLAVPELDFITSDSTPSLLIWSPEFAEAAAALVEKTQQINMMICEKTGFETADYESWIADRETGEPLVIASIGQHNPLIIMYTSGTTGRPKGAILSHGNLIWNAINSQHLSAYTASTASLCSAPLFHIGALNVAVLPHLYVGGRVVLQRFFEPAEAVRLIGAEKINVMFGVPVMFQFMMQVPGWDEADFSSVDNFVAGGAPCSRALIEAYLAKGVRFVQDYGLTETSAGVSLLLPDDALRKIGSSGQQIFNLELKIVDQKNLELPPGEIGEIIVRGPTVIREYWNLTAENAAAFVDGWFHTGDLGYLDSEWYLFIVDRKKDMYISGGENVYPAEIEAVISGFPGIAEVAVIGVPDKKWGETGLAIIVPKDGCEFSTENLLAYYRAELAGYKRPRRVVVGGGPLPKTASGKLVKKDLKKLYL